MSNASNQPTALPPITIGTRLTDYGSFDLTVEGMASGGMGLVVWGPNAARGGRKEAAKLLRPDLLSAAQAHSPEQAQRLQADFEREALIWCHLWPHPYLITANGLTRLSTWNGLPVLMLEYAPHGSLRHWLVEAHQPGKACAGKRRSAGRSRSPPPSSPFTHRIQSMSALSRWCIVTSSPKMS